MKTRTKLIRSGLQLAVVAAATVLLWTTPTRAQVTLTDIGATAPTPGPDDITQLVPATGPNSPDGLNYYFDNSTPPGQTFTTGSGTSGYVLTTLAILTAGNSGQLPAAGQAYLLRIYTVSQGTNAALLATYTSQDGFTFTDLDWLQWTGLEVALPANMQFAYSFGRVPSGAGWENLANVTNNPYAGGEVALIPPTGGAMTLGSSHDYDATFDVGLTAATSLLANPPQMAPSSAVTRGTAVTLTATAVGPGPLSYQWQTDGGSGGALTNIPTATGTTLAVDTTGLFPGFYTYDVIVSNGTSSITSPTATLSIYVEAAAALADVGDTVVSGPYDISQLVVGPNMDGLNYYDDNGASHGGLWAGQTFTTGTNSQGYYLTSVAFETGGGGSDSTSVLMPYELFIYSVEGSEARFMAHYTNASFSFTFGDWLEWSGFSLVLASNSTYAYGFGRSASGTGWAALNTSPGTTDLYPGGQICFIPTSGGALTFGNTGLSDAVFDIGLQPIGVGPSPFPFANAISVSPSRTVAPSTVVTLSEVASGQAPLHYIWKTDGGSGTLTNIPASDSTNLVVNTTGWSPGVYQFAVLVSNVFGTATSPTTTLTVLYANTTAMLSDVGASIPTPGGNDISQLTPASAANSPDNLNYYFDNGSPPGQTFTTGSNPGGYTLSSLAIDLAGNSGGLPADGQDYILRLYTVSGGNAVLYAVYTSQAGFTFGTTDWLRWFGFAVPLAANATYAYTLARDPNGSGWDNLSNVGGDPFAGGEVVLIPPSGGAIVTGSSHSYDGTFVIGLALPGYPVVSPATFSPSNVVYAGSPVTLSASVSGTGPFTYQWMSDGGTGGALTNIPGAISSTLAVDTTGMDGMTVAYALSAANGSGTTVGEPAYLTIVGASIPSISVDTTPGSAERFVGRSVTFAASFVGTLPISYQWQVDKGTGPTNIVGQTSASLALTNLALTDTGNYSLVATNVLGNGSSTPASLTVVLPPTGTYDRALLSYGPLAYWEFNEPALSTTAYDCMGGFDGTYETGCTSGVPGLPVSLGGLPSGDFAVECVNGNVNSGVTVPALNFPATNTVTWTAWIYPSSINGASTTYTQAAWTGIITTRASTYAGGVNYNGQGMLGYTWNQNNGNTWGFVSGLVIPSNQWSFVAVALSPTNAALYLINSGGFQMTNNPIAHDAETWNGAATIGYDDIDGTTATNRTFNGVIDDVTIFTHTLTTADIQHLYAAIPYSPPVTLNIQRSGASQIKLDWSQGTLLEAPALTGPWTTNLNSSPYIVTPTGAQKFYRVRVQ